MRLGRNPGLRRLLVHALEQGWLSDAGFRRGRERIAEYVNGAEYRRMLEEIGITFEPFDSDPQFYAHIMCDTTPPLRNYLAHGASAALRGALLTLETCAETINQVFAPQEQESATTRVYLMAGLSTLRPRHAPDILWPHPAPADRQPDYLAMWTILKEIPLAQGDATHVFASLFFGVAYGIDFGVHVEGQLIESASAVGLLGLAFYAFVAYVVLGLVYVALNLDWSGSLGSVALGVGILGVGGHTGVFGPELSEMVGFANPLWYYGFFVVGAFLVQDYRGWFCNFAASNRRPPSHARRAAWQP